MYTIIDYYSDILFTLENDSNFEENKADSRISNHFYSFMILAITVMNTSALKDTKSLCLCIALLDNLGQNDNWLVELNMQALSNIPDDRFQSNSSQRIHFSNLFHNREFRITT